ncbi:MAG: hypothetical protein M1815_001397 [Lichina confinis]|nr:MAG: hypothetical protein M1815_001397 [Lichina confinis]
MAYPLLRLGGHAFNHSRSDAAEAEYDRLRGLARHEAAQRSQCFDRSRQAYEHGDGAGAHDYSQQGKRHAHSMEQYNRQASEYIFLENNADGRVPSDTIDLHGQYVSEAEEILEQRIRAAQAGGESHLHAIVGKGNHSANHVQKLKPRVEQVCRELGLHYTSEENAGRIYIDLRGGAAHPGGQHHAPSGQHHQQQHHHQQQQHQQQQQQQEDLIDKVVKRLFRKAESCCIVM